LGQKESASLLKRPDTTAHLSVFFGRGPDRKAE
jgi:hypothetical protein